MALTDGGAEYTAKRDELVRIATRFFREHGYQAARLSDIAAEAGIDRASLYYYVSSKQELLQESMGGILGANLLAAQALALDSSLDVRTRLQRIFELLMASYAENYPQMYVYIQEQMHQVSREPSAWAKEILKNTRRFEAVVVSLIRAGIESGEFREDVPVKVVSNAVFGMFNWTHRWFTPGGGLSAAEVSKGFIEIFFDGMSRKQGG